MEEEAAEKELELNLSQEQRQRLLNDIDKLKQVRLIVIFSYFYNQGSISLRVRTSPNLGLALGDIKNARLVLS